MFLWAKGKSLLRRNMIPIHTKSHLFCRLAPYYMIGLNNAGFKKNEKSPKMAIDVSKLKVFFSCSI